MCQADLLCLQGSLPSGRGGAESVLEWADVEKTRLHVASLELRNRGPDAKTGRHRCFRRKTASRMPSFYPTETRVRIPIFTTVKFKEILYANMDK